jgi:hypothetical protein
MRRKTEIAGRTLLAKTCPTCLEFKQAFEFNIDPKLKNGGHRTNCRVCHMRISNAIRKRFQSESIVEASKNRTEWTEKEIEHLQQLVNAGLKSREIARIMSRTYASITNTRHRELIRKNNYTAIPGSPIDQLYLRELIHGQGV